jgi:hypothetical protein
MEDFIGKYDGNQIDSRLDKVKDMVGATASGAGVAGLVPAPAKGDEGRFLCGDGTWKDAVAKSDDEDAFLAIILQLVGDQSTTLPQSQYNTIKSLFDGSSTSNVRMIRPNNSFVEALGGVNINDLMVFNDQRNDCITIYISASNNSLNMGFSDISISVYPNLNVEYINSSLNIASSDNTEIVIVRFFGNTEDNIDFDNQLHLKMKGKGDKALMDDGTYKEIGSSGVDISSYILEGIDFKKNTTKEGFDKIKSCIINKQHMYVYYKVEMGGDVAAFTSDVITNFLYGNISLVMVDFSNIELKQVVINSSDYNITVTKI